MRLFIQRIQRHLVLLSSISVLILIALLVLFPRQVHAETTDCATQSEIPQAECEALVALYNSTDGPNWTDNTGWNETQTPCSWYGVMCEGDVVTHLSLGVNQLSGIIPPEIGDLTNLKVFSLFQNRLNGSIPPEFGNLSSLEHLFLYNNQLSGSIPTQIKNLTNLTELSLYSNQLTGNIPPEISNLSNLTHLALSVNQLSGNIPPEIGTLANLRSLELGENQLSGEIPATIGNLTKLELLFLYYNQLTGEIPVSIGTLINMHTLSMYGNQLTGNIPPELGNLNSLQQLGLSSNQLSGSIPAELGNLSNLEYLWLNNNQLSDSIPATIGNLTKLEDLTLHNNQLSGSIPSEIGNLSSLRHLSLADNQLSDSIPLQLGSLANLESLALYSNQLSGSIPATIGSLSSLKHLVLSNNQLSGSIPATIGNLINLQYVDLGVNQLSGNLPPEMGNLANLKSLYLYVNQLSGSIPPEIGSLTSLELLTLMDNQLSGSIPLELGNLTNLQYLDLGSNQLSGEIPLGFSLLTNLNTLGLSDNQLSGSIPPEIGNLTNLTYLYLWGNQLTGSIPAQIGSLTGLHQLIMSGNQLSGDVPASLTNLVNLTDLNIHFNMLTASDPDVIAFLDAKCPGWLGTQTIPPTNVNAGTPTDDSIPVIWTPLPITGTDPDDNVGYYEVGYRSVSDGSYTIAGQTTDKTASSYTVTGLDTDQTYYLAIRTFTPQHEKNPTALTSGWSTEVAASTGSGGENPPLSPVVMIPDTPPTVIVTINTIGNPVFEWTDTGAAGYQLFVGGSYQGMYTGVIVFFDENLPRDPMCDGAVCRLRLTDVNPAAWLYNGEFMLFLNAAGGALEDWKGPYYYKVHAPAPTPPTITSGATPPAIAWELPGAAANAAFFQVYIAPADDLSNPAVFQWVGRDEACGSWESTTCTWTPGVSLPAGRAYHIYMQSWGAGGFSEGGEFGIGWSMGMFNVGGPTPGLPDAATFDYVVNGGQVTITFPDDPNATSVYFFIGNVGVNPLVINFMAELTDAQLGCNGTTCTFTPTLDIPLTPETYTVYVQPKSSGGPRGDGYVNLGWFDAGTFNVP